MTIGLIDGGSEEKRNQTISALVLAFIRDPMMRWLYPEPEAYLSHFPGFLRCFGGPAFQSDTAWLSDDLGGAALWFPSGAHPDDSCRRT